MSRSRAQASGRRQSPSDLRPWHVLRPVQGLSVPRRCLFFQVSPQVREIRRGLREHTFGRGLGIACDLKDGQIVDIEECIFPRPDDLWSWIWSCRAKDTATWVYAYNMLYCLQLADFWRSLSRGSIEITSAVLNDPPTIILTRWGRRCVRFVDVQNYYRDSLRDLMRHRGTCSPSGTGCATCDPDGVDALRGRVHRIKDLVCSSISVVARHALCSWQPTAASLSWAAYRHSYLDTPIYLHSHLDALQLERDSLFGGRLQMFATGLAEGPVTILDANSLYPWAMRSHLHPIKWRRYHEQATLQDLRAALRGYWCVADVRVLPGSLVLPLRVAHHTAFAAGEGPYCLGDPELRQACGLGIVLGVGRLGVYEAGSPFTQFVDDLYRHKLRAQSEGKSLEVCLWKMLLNSLAGKFGQKGRRWVDVNEKFCPTTWGSWYGRHPDTGSVCRYRCLGGYAQRLEEGLVSWNSFPALCSSITSAGRVQLSRWLELARSGQVLYTDTDSLHVLGDGLDRLVAAGECHPTALGKLKHQVVGPDAYYWGLKHYRVGDRYCCNVLNATTREVTDGLYMTESRRGWEYHFNAGVLDRVLISDRPYRVPAHHERPRLPLLAYGDPT